MKKSITIIFCSIFALLSFMFSSCSSSAPDNKINAQRSEPVGWVYDSTQGKNIQTEQVYYLLSPTLKQSFYFADKRSDRKVNVFLSIFCIVLFVVIFVLNIKNRGPEFLQNGYFFAIAQFVILVAALSFFLSKPLGIRWNNEKWVKKEVYEKAMQTGSTKPIWDSLQTNCFIIDGPYDCYKK